MLNKFLAIIKLARLNSPIGYLLSFFPACYGIILASASLADLKILPKFFIGSVIVRSAGCIINDLLDRNIDGRVARTSNRPLVDGSISVVSALLTLLAFLSLGLFILLTLNKLAIYLGIIAFWMIMLYPLMKRFTYLPQLFLGLTFNMGALIGYASVSNDVSLAALLMYAACIFWTIGYDTIYGFMDIDDDKKVGVKSTSLLLENKGYKVWLYAFYIAFIILFLLAIYAKSLPIFDVYYLSIGSVGLVLALAILLWSVRSLDIARPANCLRRFKINSYVGIILSISVLIINNQQLIK